MNQDENKKKYWDGKANRFIRYYYYLVRGVDEFNRFKYIVGAILGFCWLIKIKIPTVILATFFISLFPIGIIGYLTVHKISKVMDFLNIEFSTHWSKYQFKLQEKQVKLLEEINERLKANSPKDS